MRLALLAPAILALAACGADTINDAQVTGSVDFDPTPSSFAGLTLEVQLQDVSIADAASIDLATQEITDISSVPVAFSLPYSSGAIDERNDYTISARAYTMVDGERRLEYTTTQSFPVITNGWPNEAQVIVEQVGE